MLSNKKLSYHRYNAALIIFPDVLIILNYSKSYCPDFIATDEWPQFTQPQSTGLSGLGAVQET